MKRIFLYTTLLFLACEQKEKVKNDLTKLNEEGNNFALDSMYQEDQNARKVEEIDWNNLQKADEQRRETVVLMKQEGLIKTAKDHYYAAMIYQHGNDSEDYKFAKEYMEEAIALDTTMNKWLLAAATDRYLLSIDQPQIYGTQYMKMGDEPWELSNYDTTAVTDEERIRMGVPVLAKQKEQLAEMNQE